jgi:hypothetical protein
MMDSFQVRAFEKNPVLTECGSWWFSRGDIEAWIKNKTAVVVGDN